MKASFRNVFLLGTLGMGSMMIGMTSCSDDDKENGGAVEKGHRVHVGKAGGVDRYAVQLWKDGPFWAEFNVGATIDDYGSVQDWNTIKSAIMATSDSKVVDTTNDNQKKLFSWVGNYYNWGKTVQHVPANKTHYCDTMISISGWVLPAPADTIGDVAKKHWGNNWQMPDTASLARLAKKRWNGFAFENDPNPVVDTVWCDGSTKKFAGSSIPGMMFRGKGDYVRDSIFFPVAGSCSDGSFLIVGVYGSYWSSVPNVNVNAWSLDFLSGDAYMFNIGNRYGGRSVRAVWAK